MNETSSKHDKIEHLMQQVRPTGLSPQLKDRVTSVAVKAWGQAPPEVPWQIPLRRLAVSAAAAVLVVSLAHVFSHRVAGQWRPGESRTTSGKPADLNDPLMTNYGDFVKHMAVSNYRPPGAGALMLRNYVEQVREMLEETQPNGDTGQPTPTPGRSRLIPISSPTKSWS